MKKLLAAVAMAALLASTLAGCNAVSEDDDDDRDRESSEDKSRDDDEDDDPSSEKNQSRYLEIKDKVIVDCDEKAKTIEIPDGVEEIGEDAFKGCVSLTSITIPDSVVSISDGAFDGAENLTGVTLPDRIVTIGKKAFRGCKALTEITIPGGVDSISDNAFSGCSNLATVTLSDGTTDIGKDAFKGCENLIFIDLSSGIKKLGSGAFNGCSSLMMLNVPDSVTSITEDIFTGCDSLVVTYKGESFTSGNIQEFYDTVNGKMVRKELTLEEVKRIVPVADNGAIPYGYLSPFDDINHADYMSLTGMLWAYDVYDFGGDLAIRFSDFEDKIRKYINPGFDVNIWRNDEDAFRYCTVLNDEEFKFSFAGGGGAPNYEGLFEDYYRIGNTYYITVNGISWWWSGDPTKCIANSQFGYDEIEYNNTHYQLIYKKVGESFYLEKIKYLEVSELPKWLQAQNALLDAMATSQIYRYESISFADLNSDGVKDIIADTVDATMSISPTHMEKFYDGATGKEINNSNYENYSWFEYDTVEQCYVGVSYYRVYGEDNESYTSLKTGKTLCSESSQERLGEHVYRIGDEEVSQKEYENFVSSRFESIPTTSFDDITFQDLMVLFHDNYTETLNPLV